MPFCSADAPPLPQKSGSVQSQVLPPTPNRNLKPPPGLQRPHSLHPHSGRLPAPVPSLPPKNVQGRSSGITPPPEAHPQSATSAPDNVYSQPGYVTGSNHSGSRTSGFKSVATATSNSPLDPAGIPKISTGMNVLQRIAQIEEENIRASAAGRTKGMEIALSLKQRIQDNSGSSGVAGSSELVGTSKKSTTNSIRKTWRKLLDKVEDSFSDNEM